MIPKVLSLFSGIGGLDLAAENAGLEVAAFCEYDPFCRQVLTKHWPGVPQFENVFTLTRESMVERGIEPDSIRIVAGGFPCQPFSGAGKRKGKDDDRYLWPEFLRVVQFVKPVYVVAENVSGLLSMGIETVVHDLENEGYEVEVYVLPAFAVGARHERKRLAIVAYAEQFGLTRRESQSAGYESDRYITEREETPGRTQTSNENGRVGIMADADQFERDRCRNSRRRRNQFTDGGEVMGDAESFNERHAYSGIAKSFGSTTGGNESERYAVQSGKSGPVESDMGRMAHGISGGLDEALNIWEVEPDIPRVAVGVKDRSKRLKALGNAVVWQQFYPFFKAIAEYEGVQ